MSFHSARRSLSSTSSTTLVSPTSLSTTNASPESLGSLATHVLSVYLETPENYHFVITEKDYSAIIAFLNGDLGSLYQVESLLLASKHTTAFLGVDGIRAGNARVIPVTALAQVLATMPYRHRVAAMVEDSRDKFLGVPESLVVAWHTRLSHHYGHLSLSHERAREPALSLPCLPLLSELPSITVAQFLSCLDNRNLFISLELYDTTVQALANNDHSSVSPKFRCSNERVSLHDGRLYVRKRTVITPDQVPDILKLLPSTASANHMVRIAQKNYYGVPESLVRDWHARLFQHHQNELDGHAAEDKDSPRFGSRPSAAGPRRVVRTREEGREDALLRSGSLDLQDPSSMHGEGTGRKRAREDEGEDEDAPRSKRRRLGDVLLWVWRTISQLRFRQRR
ncbi:hypothetical protein CPB85DRAFT_1460365 [Mucidula mucida]|nr:hypothetical protein CPB85DRAFT_1460365 [Mucidula mucida]